MIDRQDHPDRDNVIALDGFRAPGQGLTPLRQAEAYWTALSRDGTVPRRSQIDPRALQNILEHAFVLERVAPGVARFRLAGHHLNGQFGMDLRGMPLSCLVTPATRPRLATTLEHVFDAPAVAEIDLTGERRLIGSAPPAARMLLLPLRGAGDAVNRILGAMVCDGPTRAGARYALGPVELRPVRMRGDRPAGGRDASGRPALQLVT